jgi:uncharacterized protein YecE (DUF72 family)
MTQLSLFDDQKPPQAARLAPVLRRLAEQRIYFGTSSWKYEGWLGSIYTPERYATRAKFSRAKFEAACLAEYAGTFPVVGGDFSFYKFPTPAYWQRLFGESPESLRFGFKVPEEITVATWPGHARYGARAGQVNESFLDADAFARGFARPLELYRERVTTLIFEFGTFSKAVFKNGASFAARLDAFLAGLPAGFPYAVEIRNPEYLSSDYFAMLADRSVAHVFNAWTRMPRIGEQAALPGAFTAPFTVVRALLRRGRTYEQAVKQFEPYREIQDPDPPTREGLAQIANTARGAGKAAFIFVNNRLEGNAPTTIEAVAASLLA